VDPYGSAATRQALKIFERGIMSSDILVLMLMCGLTVIAYMIAINAHGAVRVSLSYLLAFVLLVGTVWAIVQHVNVGYDSMKTEELKKMEAEKKQAEEHALSQEEALKANKERMAFAVKLNAIITSGAAYSSGLTNVDLQDRSAELETLIGRAAESKKMADAVKQDFEKLSSSDNFFSEPLTLIRDGIQLLTEAAQYYQQYYYSDDSDQEASRARIMKQKARNASEKFQKASVLIATSG
jgi:hypothetical protein